MSEIVDGLRRGLYMYRSVTSVQFTGPGTRKPTHTRAQRQIRAPSRPRDCSVQTRDESALAARRSSCRGEAVVPTLATGAHPARRTAALVSYPARTDGTALLSEFLSLVLHSCAHAAGTSQLKRSGPIDGARCNQGSMKVTFLSKAATAAARTSGGMPFRRPSKCSSTGVLPE
jgi:hypothetical protein